MAAIVPVLTQCPADHLLWAREGGTMSGANVPRLMVTVRNCCFENAGVFLPGQSGARCSVPLPLRSTTPRYPHPPQVERFPLPTTPGLLCKLQPSLDTSSPSDPLPPNPEATKSHLSYRRLRGVSWDREQASEPGSEGPIHCQSPAPRLGDTPPTPDSEAFQVSQYPP
jgi:hypothetical protein